MSPPGAISSVAGAVAAGPVGAAGLVGAGATTGLTSLREVHRFFCLRFPEEPIGVGAKWKDICHLRTGGVIDTREVIWELTNLSTDAKGRRRADFTYLGNYSAPGEPTPRTGTVQGILYFFLDSGEPHLIKEQIVTRREPTSQFQTVTTISYQFGKFATDKKGKETVLRTDGDLRDDRHQLGRDRGEMLEHLQGARRGLDGAEPLPQPVEVFGGPRPGGLRIAHRPHPGVGHGLGVGQPGTLHGVLQRSRVGLRVASPM